MPNILVKVPKDSFSPEARKSLGSRLNEAAAIAEQIPVQPQMRALTWVLIEEVDSEMWTCGGRDMSVEVLTCLAIVNVPAGVLVNESRALYVKLIHDAFAQSLPPEETRKLATSVILHDIVDGAWGGSGSIWDLQKLSKAAGYEHFQNLNQFPKLVL